MDASDPSQSSPAATRADAATTNSDSRSSNTSGSMALGELQGVLLELPDIVQGQRSVADPIEDPLGRPEGLPFGAAIPADGVFEPTIAHDAQHWAKQFGTVRESSGSDVPFDTRAIQLRIGFVAAGPHGPGFVGFQLF